MLLFIVRFVNLDTLMSIPSLNHQFRFFNVHDADQRNRTVNCKQVNHMTTHISWLQFRMLLVFFFRARNKEYGFVKNAVPNLIARRFDRYDQ